MTPNRWKYVAVLTAALIVMNVLGMLIGMWLPASFGGDMGRIVIAFAAGYTAVDLACGIAQRNDWL